MHPYFALNLADQHLTDLRTAADATRRGKKARQLRQESRRPKTSQPSASALAWLRI
jgi:hypothetical protein